MVNQEDIIFYFKTEFESLMKRFNDTRELKYSLDELNENELVDCNWSQQHINISFKTIPINYYLSNPAHVKIFEGKPKTYKNYFNQVARHEYGHSISCESFDKINSYKLTLEQFYNRRINNQFFSIYLHEIFFEFIANYLVYDKIDQSIPNEYLEINFNSFETTFTAGYGIFVLIKECLLYSQVFFIYAEWDKLFSIFTEFKVDLLLDYLYITNDIFKKIIIKNTGNEYLDMDSAICEISDLASILDGINWKQMVLERHHEKSSYKLLKKFKNRF